MSFDLFDIYTRISLAHPMVSPSFPSFTALESLGNSQARGYQVAKEIVPNLVATETPLVGFLRTEDYNPQKAALRLTLYWKYRKEVFGDRWLLPMQQTGRGSLNVQDIEFIRTGWMNFYTASDHNGEDQPLAIADMSKLTDFADQAAAKGWDINAMYDRCTMYMGTVQSNVASQRKGLVLMHLVDSKPRPVLHLRQDSWDIAQSALPIRLKRTMVVQAYEYGKEELLDFVRSKTAAAIAYNAKRQPDQVHDVSITGTARRLEAVLGLTKNFLPLALGGSVSLDDTLAEWTRARLSLEEMTSVVPMVLDRNNPGRASQHVLTRKAKGEGPLLKRKRDEEESEEIFCKKRNALYSRRMYHKRKLETLSLDEEVKKWQDANKKARNENQRLEGLMGQARAILCGYSITTNSVHAHNQPHEFVTRPAFATFEPRPCAPITPRFTSSVPWQPQPAPPVSQQQQQQQPYIPRLGMPCPTNATWRERTCTLPRQFISYAPGGTTNYVDGYTPIFSAHNNNNNNNASDENVIDDCQGLVPADWL